VVLVRHRSPPTRGSLGGDLLQLFAAIVVAMAMLAGGTVLIYLAIWVVDQ
jgi:hypothetical protein